MNQKSRKTASSKIEKDFYQLLNNSNFGIDCRNDFTEISYIKNYTTIFADESLRDLFLPDLLRLEIEQTFHGKIFALNKEDPTYEARKLYLERKNCRGVIFQIHKLQENNEKEEVSLVSIAICLNVVVEHSL